MNAHLSELPEALKNLQPAALWHHFNQVRQIPRRSYHEEGVRQYIESWAKEHNFKSKRDPKGNLVVYVPGTPGSKNNPPLIVQAHMDMVCKTAEDHSFDFDTQAIPIEKDGNFIQAEGAKTTLGADNGIGLAAMLALAENTTNIHSPLELLFTVEEEDGLKGATAFDSSLVNGRLLLNVDSEDGVEFISVASAGGERLTAILPIEKETIKLEQYHIFEIKIYDLPGGHSGMEINNRRGNALITLGKILQRSLAEIPELLLSTVQSGNDSNAIPDYAEAIIGLPKGVEAQSILGQILTTARTDKDFLAIQKDPADQVKTGNPKILMEPFTTGQQQVPTFLKKSSQQRIINILTKLPNGVITMSQRYVDLVQTSSNLGLATTTEDTFTAKVMVRSSNDEDQTRVTKQISEVFSRFGATVKLEASYSGWEGDPESVLLAIAHRISQKLFGHKLKEKRVHAGLETGAFSRCFPKAIDMSSVGPHIIGAHRIGEKVDIQSVQNWWKFLLEYIRAITENDNPAHQ